MYLHWRDIALYLHDPPSSEDEEFFKGFFLQGKGKGKRERETGVVEHDVN